MPSLGLLLLFQLDRNVVLFFVIIFFMYFASCPGCASFVTPTNDEGLPYNNLQWHLLVARREEKIARISIDIHWTGLLDNYQ